MTTTRVASANVKRGLGWEPLQAIAHRILDRNADIIGFQEIFGTRQKRLRKLMARRGYGLAFQQGNPIAYDLKRYKRLDHDQHRLGPNIGTDAGNPTRFANVLTLRDKSTGQVTVMTNTHLGRHRNSHETHIARRQARSLGQLQHDLRERYGPDAAYYVSGDMNTADHLPLGLKNHHGTGDRIDRIFSNRKLRGSSMMNTASDHDALFATFRDRKRPAPGGGGAHTNNNGLPAWADHFGSPKGGKKGGKGDNDDDHKGVKKFNQSAYDLFADLLESWGIPVGSDIEKIIKHAMIEGRTPDQIDLLIPDIQNTQSWKKRFPGWHKRVENGYNQLNVEEYLSLENSYHRIMQEAGLPAGFYDDPSDMGNWIANDVSPDEVQNRVGIAVKTAQSVDPTVRNLMARHYGLTTGDIASFFLDQSRALPVIERQYNAANVASWASRAGFDVNGMSRYESLVDSGISAEQAAQSYGTIKSLTDAAGTIAGVYGDTFDQGDAEDDVFFGRDQKRRKLFSQEKGTFSGSSRGSTGSAQRQGY